jgi:hypothetical protein
MKSDGFKLQLAKGKFIGALYMEQIRYFALRLI